MEPEEGHLGEDPLPEAQVGEEGALGLNGLLVKEGLLPSPLHEAVAHGVKEEALLPRGEVVLLEEGEGPPGQGHRLSAAEGEAVGVQGLHGAVVGVGEGAGVGPGGLGLPEGAKEPLPQGLGRPEEGLLGQGEKAEEGVGPPPQGGEALRGREGPGEGPPGQGPRRGRKPLGGGEGEDGPARGVLRLPLVLKAAVQGEAVPEAAVLLLHVEEEGEVGPHEPLVPGPLGEEAEVEEGPGVVVRGVPLAEPGHPVVGVLQKPPGVGQGPKPPEAEHPPPPPKAAGRPGPPWAR